MIKRLPPTDKRTLRAKSPLRSGPRKLILRSFLSPGDIVMMTATVRDLHRAYPGRFLTDVRTACPALWENNPHITPIADDDPQARILDLEYPLVHRSNTTPYHFISGYMDDLGQKLDLEIPPTEFRGDIHISPREKQWFSHMEGKAENPPFWLVTAGGKWDFTAKWWSNERYQQVVDHFAGKIEFVQVGDRGHNHSPLRGVVDMRGDTNLRQLVRLMYHAQGALSPVSLLMHLAAAVPVKPGMPQNRPCVVVAGGREPVQWEAYPHHQFLHTAGALLCCDNGGCWKSRVVPLGDGDEKDSPSNLCIDIVGQPRGGNLPRCLDMITAQEVIRRIELYFEGGAVRYLEKN
jgi:ADP-heptose:LPS heptosyltransferase